MKGRHGSGERRGAERVAVSVVGEFLVRQQRRRCELRDLSSSGALFRAPVHHLEDSWVHLQFVVPEVGGSVTIDGLVVRRRRRSGDESEWAIRLDRSNDQKNRILDRFVAKALAGETGSRRSIDRPAGRPREDRASIKALYREALERLQNGS